MKPDRATTHARAYGGPLRHDLAELQASFADASTTPFWLDDPARPAPRPALAGDTDTDLVVVGGGYCGLWTALIAKERDPGRRVVLIEAERIGWAASGRNGGFCEPSLTHGEINGERHFKKEMAAIAELEEQNFRDFEATLTRYGIDAEWELSGVLTVATEPEHVEELAEYGEVLTGDALARLGGSPLYRAGLFEPHSAFVHPAKLAWGLAAAAEKLGVEIHENTRATGISTTRDGVVVATKGGSIRASHAALATNGFPSLLPMLGLFTVPVYDYALMTEPLTKQQLKDIGWTGRHGITDSSRQFHYYRKTADDRILWGGYDAIYHRGRQVKDAYDQRPATFERLADHFFATFPQLRGIRFTHRWGGAIDMSTKLVAFHGTTRNGRVAYSAGYTGLGVGATRFGAETMLDLLAGADTPRTRLSWARKLPIPIPPEPFAYPIIQIMRRAVAKSDRIGKDSFLVRVAALFGVGFDS